MSKPELPRLAAYLRAETRAAHHRLDRHPALAALTAATLDLDAYARALAALHGAHGAIESALRGFAPAAAFPDRLPDLEADLRDLRQEPCPVRIPVPAAVTPAARVGMMYVIEGSNLGGRMIGRRLAASLPAGSPQRFFGHAGPAGRWERFWDFAVPHCADAQRAVAARAARATFAFYLAHIEDVVTTSRKT